MSGIMFFEKNKIDLTLLTGVVFTITDAIASNTGSTYAYYVTDRRNWSGWSTTGSTDAAVTTFEVEFPANDIDTLMIVNHNFKNFTIKYWNGSSYVNFSSTIAPTTNTDSTNYYSFTSVNTTKIQIVINGTMVADADKFLSQLILTKAIGQFTQNWVIGKPVHDKNKKEVKSISGRVKVFRNQGAFQCQLKSKNVIAETDLTIIESLYDITDGFLVWICGNNTTQFRTQRIGYRKQDIFHMVTTNSYEPEWNNGFYNQGTNLQINLTESV